MSHPAVFLDRDGVINRERADYVKSWAEFEFLPGSLSALNALSALPWPIILVTNQSVIGRGVVTAQAVEDLHQQMQEAIRTAGGRIDAIFLCPHRPDEACACRKPQPGLLLQAAQALDLTLSACYFVGDALSDLQAAQAAGCQPVLVCTGRQGQAVARLAGSDPAIPVLADLPAAVALILRRAAGSGVALTNGRRG